MFLVITTLSLSSNATAFDHSHGVWDILLKKHVVMRDENRSSRVNYEGMKKDVALFETYRTSLSSVSQKEYDTWTRNQKLAFLINAYNAFTIKLVLDHYPVASIRDIGGLFKSPWKIEFISLLEKTRSLDDIEHQMIRQKGVFDEPRIHVALVCAAIGCPALRNEAYTDEKLEAMLESSLVHFLSDPTRNRFNAKKNRFEISSIFNWYEQDFIDKYGSLKAFLIINAQNFTLGNGDLDTINQGKFTVDFLDYDWTLNNY